MVDTRVNGLLRLERRRLWARGQPVHRDVRPVHVDDVIGVPVEAPDGDLPELAFLGIPRAHAVSRYRHESGDLAVEVFLQIAPRADCPAAQARQVYIAR